MIRARGTPTYIAKHSITSPNNLTTALASPNSPNRSGRRRGVAVPRVYVEKAAESR